jgi:hypothetical protein
MKPNEINKLTDLARTLLAQPDSAVAGFLVAYAAWEAFVLRVLIVGLAARGNTVEQSKAIILKSQVWRQDNQKAAFEEIYGTQAHQLKGIGKFFRSVSKAKDVRNSFIHGNRAASPQRFQELGLEIIGILEADWESPIRALIKAQGIHAKYCNPMSRIRANQT